MSRWKYESHSSLGQFLIPNLPTMQNCLNITFIFHKVLSGLPCIFIYLNGKVIHWYCKWWLRFYHYCSYICLGQKYGINDKMVSFYEISNLVMIESIYKMICDDFIIFYINDKFSKSNFQIGGINYEISNSIMTILSLKWLMKHSHKRSSCHI